MMFRAVSYTHLDVYKRQKERQLNETFEWLIKCAENDATCLEGIAELVPNSDFMSGFLVHKKQTLETIIDIEKKERLKKALLNTQNEINFGLVLMVYEQNEKRIDDFLLSRLKSLDAEYWLSLIHI